MSGRGHRHCQHNTTMSKVQKSHEVFCLCSSSGEQLENMATEHCLADEGNSIQVHDLKFFFQFLRKLAYTYPAETGNAFKDKYNSILSASLGKIQ